MNLSTQIQTSSASEQVKKAALEYAAIIERYAPCEPTGIEAKENILALKWGAIQFIFTDKYAVIVTPIFKKGSTSRFTEKNVKKTFFAYQWSRLNSGTKIYLSRMQKAMDSHDVFMAEQGHTKVFIWSDERKAYWRPKQGGYTKESTEAGVYTLAEAWKVSSHCDDEKKIIYEVV